MSQKKIVTAKDVGFEFEDMKIIFVKTTGTLEFYEDGKCLWEESSCVVHLSPELQFNIASELIMEHIKENEYWRKQGAEEQHRGSYHDMEEMYN